MKMNSSERKLTRSVGGKAKEFREINYTLFLIRTDGVVKKLAETGDRFERCTLKEHQLVLANIKSCLWKEDYPCDLDLVKKTNFPNLSRDDREKSGSL